MGSHHRTPEEKAAHKAKKAAKKAAKEAGKGEKRTAEDGIAALERKAEKKEKKEKKENGSSKASAPVSSPSLTEFAQVGDRSIPSSAPAIVKRLSSSVGSGSSRPASEVSAWSEERKVVLEDADGVLPALSFAEFGLEPSLLACTRGFSAPSAIQSACVPLAAAGRDVIGVAATGSGKTLAFGLPLLAHCAANAESAYVPGRGRLPSALVLAPTRELAIQIEGVLAGAAKGTKLTTLVAYGGVPKRPQIDALRKGVNALVGTPGRLKDLLESLPHLLSRCSFLVLDEADRMLDLGFEPDIRALAGAVRADRQTLMFSATWPPEVRGLAANFLGPRPARVTVGGAPEAAGGGPRASRSVAQHVRVIEDRDRDAALDALLRKLGAPRHGGKGGKKIIVFVLYKKEAARVEQRLVQRGWPAEAVHGDASQAARELALERFKSGEKPILVATDVAARGLDVDDVAAVINYSFPLTIEDYVHRIGRTGRAGKTGEAYTFFVGANDKPRAGELVNVLKQAEQPVPEELYKFGTTVKKKESKLYGAHFRNDITAKSTKITFDD